MKSCKIESWALDAIFRPVWEAGRVVCCDCQIRGDTVVCEPRLSAVPREIILEARYLAKIGVGIDVGVREAAQRHQADQQHVRIDRLEMG